MCQSRAKVADLVGKTRDKLGPIDHLAHCGAISNIADHSEMTYDLWFETIDVNLNGAFLAVFAVKDEMLERQRGSIVVIRRSLPCGRAANKSITPVRKPE